MDDSKIGCVSDKQNKTFVQWLKDMHEDEAGKVKVSEGNEHDFSAVDIAFEKGHAIVSMKRHIEKAVEGFEFEHEINMKPRHQPKRIHLQLVRTERNWDTGKGTHFIMQWHNCHFHAREQDQTH